VDDPSPVWHSDWLYSVRYVYSVALRWARLVLGWVTFSLMTCIKFLGQDMSVWCPDCPYSFRNVTVKSVKRCGHLYTAFYRGASTAVVSIGL